MRLFKWNESGSQKRWPFNEGQDTEANAVINIRGMCLNARVAAKITADDPENTEAHRAYLNAKDKCIAVAEGISDRFYRDTALHFIYALCQRANDEAGAKRIFNQITTYEIRGNILDGRPALFD